MSRAEAGAAKTWVLAFVLMAGVGLGGLIGVGCLVGANVCPGSSSQETTTDGRVLYQTNCALCHGPEARGARGPSLVSGALGALSADELAPKISKGKPLAGMPRFRHLTSAQIRAIAEYVVSLRGES